MKQMVIFFLFLAITAFAEKITLDNQTSYSTSKNKAKIAIQWANTAQEVEEGNNIWTYTEKLNKAGKVQVLSKSGKTTLTVPENAEYFRIVVWKEGKEDPDLITNWVDVAPNKTYTFNDDHLFAAILMSGMGC